MRKVLGNNPHHRFHRVCIKTLTLCPFKRDAFSSRVERQEIGQLDCSAAFLRYEADRMQQMLNSVHPTYLIERLLCLLIVFMTGFED
jgi:hypothetical protein